MTDPTHTIDPALPPPRRAGTRRSIADGGVPMRVGALRLADTAPQAHLIAYNGSTGEDVESAQWYVGPRCWAHNE